MFFWSEESYCQTRVELGELYCLTTPDKQAKMLMSFDR